VLSSHSDTAVGYVLFVCVSALDRWSIIDCQLRRMLLKAVMQAIRRCSQFRVPMIQCTGAVGRLYTPTLCCEY